MTPTPEELDAIVYAQYPDFDRAHDGPSIDDVRAMMQAALAKWGTPTPAGEPVGWEWRWKDTSPHTVTSGQWSEWKRVEARSRLSTVEDAVREFQHYIADGAAYELRQIFTAPPVREPLDGWIDPNDKAQAQYLPHIGEPVLFCHGGQTYWGKHSGGSFVTGVGFAMQHFATWECHWQYPPAAHGITKGDTNGKP
jgi:hypothetical protein